MYVISLVFEIRKTRFNLICQFKLFVKLYDSKNIRVYRSRRRTSTSTYSYEFYQKIQKCTIDGTGSPVPYIFRIEVPYS